MNITTGSPGWPQDISEQELEQHFSLYPLAGGDGEEGGSSGDAPGNDANGDKGTPDGGTGSGEGKAIFTPEQQDYVNKLLASNKRELRRDSEMQKRENDTLKAELSSSVARFDEYTKKVESIEAEAKKKLEDEEHQKLTKAQQRDVDYDARLKAVQKASEEKIGAMQQDLNASKETSAKAVSKQREAMKWAAVKDGLIVAGSVDPTKQAVMYFDKLELDEEKDIYMYRKAPKEFEDEGQLVSVSDGIKAELPAWCKKPMGVGGGSGGASANGQGEVSKDDLTEAKSKLAEYKNAAQKGGGASQLVMKYQMQKDLITKMEKDLKA